MKTNKIKEEIENNIKKDLKEFNNDKQEFPEWFRIRCIEYFELGRKDFDRLYKLYKDLIKASNEDLELIEKLEQTQKQATADFIKFLEEIYSEELMSVWISRKTKDKIKELKQMLVETK